MKKYALLVLAVFIGWVTLITLTPQIAHFISERTGYIHLQFRWANFDGIHYLNIAEKGYTSDMRFMPMFPILIHLVEKVTHHHFWSAFIIVYTTLSVAVVYLYKLLRLDYSPKQSLLLTGAIFMLPTSFFFGMVYTESIFLLFSVLSFYFARKGKWLLASLFGICTSLTRIVGFIIVIPLIIEFFSQKHTKKVHHFLALLFVPLGTILYAGYNFILWGNPYLFIQAHSQLSNGRSSDSLVLFPQTIYRYIKMLSTVSISLWEWKIALLELSLFLLAALSIFFLWKMKVRLSYFAYALASIAVPASTGTFTGLPRYLIVLFPLLIPLLRIRNKFTLAGILICSLILQLILLLYFWQGYYVA